jgi:pimeloyl-ACP methyl ester carboxylesterase
VPLETDLTTPLACYLGQTHFEKAGYLSFFRPDMVGEHGGLHFLEPYQPGKIPVVLIHGLLSSPQTWAPVINELQGDPVLRRHFRFGVHYFPTGEPYLATAADLRRDLARYRHTVDPHGKDAALKEVVLAGHSMGGLIGRLLTVDGGDDFFATSSPVPLASMKLTPQVHQEMVRLYYFRHDPGVRRVIFCGTPHRGSDLSPSMLGRLAAKIAGVPKQLLETTHEVMQLNPHLGSTKCKMHSSIELLSPHASALQVLAERPLPTGVKYHSVIGVALSKALFIEGCFGGDGQSGDGVIPYSSSHFEGAASEVLVQSDHYHVHHHPLAIREMRRILYEHLEEIRRRAP